MVINVLKTIKKEYKKPIFLKKLEKRLNNYCEETLEGWTVIRIGVDPMDDMRKSFYMCKVFTNYLKHIQVRIKSNNPLDPKVIRDDFLMSRGLVYFSERLDVYSKDTEPSGFVLEDSYRLTVEILVKYKILNIKEVDIMDYTPKRLELLVIDDLGF